MVEDMDMTDRYKVMVDECAKLFGGLDILALDLVHAKEGKEWILELNDTAIGLVHNHANEDMLFMRDLVVTKMSDKFCKQAILTPEDNNIELLRQNFAVLQQEIQREKQKSSQLVERIKKYQEENPDDEQEEKNCIQQ